MRARLDDAFSGTVLVTGAAGFLGRAVCRHLLTEGWRVRAGIRRSPMPADMLGHSGLEQIPCDLSKPDEVRAALDGVDAVVHAAYGEVAGMEREFAGLLEAASRPGAPPLVYLSSIAVYGERTGEVRETDTPVGALTDYAAAKIACETALREWTSAADEFGRRATVLRPGIIYGTGSPFWIEKLGRRIRLGAWGTFGEAGEGLAALVHVDEVARAIGLSLRVPGEGLSVLNITGPECPSWNRYFLALAGQMECRLRSIGPLECRLRIAASLPAKVWRRLGLPGFEALSLAPTRDEMKLFARKARYPSERARDEIGWEPAIGLEDGLKRTQRVG